jgi:hypothetical protein
MKWGMFSSIENVSKVLPCLYNQKKKNERGYDLFLSHDINRVEYK